MIHFFLTFGKDAADSPFGRRLVEMGVPHRVIAADVRHRYRNRWWMLLVGRPQTAWFAVKAAFRSLVVERPRPQAVVVWTHIEALIVAALRLLVLRQRRTRIVLVGFILTQRSGALHQLLRTLYFRTVFAVVDLVVVHSSVEAANYAQRFKGSRARFVFIPWGSHIEGLAAVIAKAERPGSGQPADEIADVVCAGRSGRDYPTVYAAFAGTSVQVRIVCDRRAALDGCPDAPNIHVLDTCYGDDYLLQLLRARCVVIPLAADDISAGQMVLLQAMEMGKAAVITRTATTIDYATDGHDAVMVEGHDPVALRHTVERLLLDDGLRNRLGSNARRSFAERFTVPAFVTQLVRQIAATNP